MKIYDILILVIQMQKKLVAHVYDIGTDKLGLYIKLFEVWETKHRTFFKETGQSDTFATNMSSYKNFLQILKENGYISRAEWIKERIEKESKKKNSRNTDALPIEVDPTVRELYENLETMGIEDHDKLYNFLSKNMYIKTLL